jgi:Tfp pilus assembly PilM family ATPase
MRLLLLFFLEEILKYIMHTSVGLDISSDTIKAIEITSDTHIIRMVKAKIPQSHKKDYTYSLIHTVNQLFATHGLSRDNVVINLRGSYVLTRTYTAPIHNTDTFERWFVNNIESLIPGTPVSEVQYDYQSLNNGRVLIAFARKSAIDEKLTLLADADIIPSCIDASSLALYYAFEYHPWLLHKLECAIIDINSATTDLLLIRKGIPFVSSEIVHDNKGDVKKTGFIEMLGHKLEKILDYYCERENYRPNGFIVTGDYARKRGIKTQLAHTFNVKVQATDPLRFQLYRDHTFIDLFLVFT